MALASMIAGLMGSAGKIFDEMHTSREEKDAGRANFMRIQGEILTKVAEFESKLTDAQASIVVAEAKSQSWLARNWRPMLMTMFGYVVAHNYIIAPLTGADYLPIPPEMWGLLKIGIGGYIGARTFEKITPEIIKLVKR